MENLTEQELQEKMEHFLLKYQAAANFVKRRRVPNKLRPYYSEPKIKRIITIREDAKAMYLKYKDMLEARKTASAMYAKYRQMLIGKKADD